MTHTLSLRILVAAIIKNPELESKVIDVVGTDDWSATVRHVARQAEKMLRAMRLFASAHGLLARLNEIYLAKEVPVSDEACALAGELIVDICDFVDHNNSLPRPDLFANRAGEISFEWLPHITNSRVIASVLLSADGKSIEYFIAEGDHVVSIEEESSIDQLTRFLYMLLDTWVKNARSHS